MRVVICLGFVVAGKTVVFDLHRFFIAVCRAVLVPSPEGAGWFMRFGIGHSCPGHLVFGTRDGSMPMLSGVNGASPWAADASESAFYLVETALGRYSSGVVSEWSPPL